MKSGKIWAMLLVVFISVKVMAQNTEGVVKGIKYNITASNTGRKIKLNDVVTFHFTAKTEKDSLLGSSYEMGQPVKIQVLPSGDNVDMIDIFTLLSENDAMTAKIPTDSMFKNKEQERPLFFPKGSMLNYTIKIEKVQSLEEAIAERDKAMLEMKNAEKDSIAKYIAKNKLAVNTTSSGLQYIITKPSVKKLKPVVGDTIIVNYTGYTMDGKVFDSSKEPGRQPYELVIGQGEVIKGWDEGFLLLDEGSFATFIIPSDLGYGPQGRGEAIKPFTPLIFEVELVKVKPVKK